jgi:hypothetical protein
VQSYFLALAGGAAALFMFARLSSLTRRLRLALPLLAGLPLAVQAQQTPLPLPSTTAVTVDFNSLGTTAPSPLPTGFVWATGTTTAYTDNVNNTTVSLLGGTSGTGAVNSNSTGGNYNFGNGVTASATDRALGFISSGSTATAAGAAPRHILLAVKNTTTSPIADLAVAYDIEKYRYGTRAFEWQFYTSADGTNWTQVTGLTQAYPGDPASPGNTVVNPPTSTPKSTTVTGINLAAGDTYYLRWSYVALGTGGSTNGQGLGLDNVVLTPTLGTSTPAPTPATITTTPSSYASPYCLTGSATLSVGYTVSSGTLPGTTFQVQLSDASGVFSTDLTKNLIGAGTTSPITATIAAGTASGTGYRVRVLNGTTIGADNGRDLTINQAPTTNTVTISPLGDQTIATNGSGTPLLAQPTAASTVSWFYGTSVGGPFSTAITGATAATYQPKGTDFPGLGDYYVVAQATSTCGGVGGTSAPIKITVAAAPPTLTASVTTLAPFGTVAVGSTSNAKSFTVSGTGLTGAITITPPVGFEIRTGPTAFACCAITLTPDATGAVANTQIDVRFAPQLAQAYADQVTVASPGFAGQTVAVSGTGSAATYPATVSTTAPTAITTTTATAGGTVSADGGSPVTAYGVAYGIDPEPTTAGSHTTDGTGLATFTSALSGLQPGVLYYLRAYATNGQGTLYGEQYTFTTVAVPLAAEPTASSQLTASQVRSTRVLLTFTGGNGTKHLLLAHLNGSVNQDPTDATTYSANSTFGQGQAIGPDADNFVLYAGVSDTVTVFGLRANTPYSFAVYDYNDNNTPYAENYLLTAPGTLTLTTPPLPPTLLLAENFAYPAGQPLVGNNWTIHSGTSNTINVTATNLTYPGYGANAGNAVLLNGTGIDENRLFSPVYARTTVYLSALVSVSNATSAGDYFLHLGNNPLTSSSYRGRLFVRKASDNSIQFGVSGSGNATDKTLTYTTTPYALNTTYLLLLRYSFDETGSQADLFINPPLNGTLPTPDATYTETGNSPVNVGAVALRQSVASMVLTVDGIMVGTDFPLATAAPLPVTLLDFTAQLAGRVVQLDWHTASEQNAARFEVERSLDATTFTRVGALPAAGTSSVAHAYAFTDAALPAGATTLYYRLRQVDVDGTSSYSPVRVVALAPSAAGLALFPNPTTRLTTLTGTGAHASVQVLDALGRTVLTATADADGVAPLALPAGLAPGVYVVRTGSQALRLLLE